MAFSESPLRHALNGLLALMLVVWSGVSPAQNGTVSAAQMKAALVANMAQYVEWPAPRPSRINLCLAGRSVTTSALRELQGRTVFGVTFDVQNLSRPFLARSNCQILFIDPTEAPNLTSWLSETAGQATLTISDNEDFANLGGMIELSAQDTRIGFEINLPAAQRNGLKLSAHLLRLARQVHGLR
ncbi:MAG: hypothetical protein RIR00_881 [Pseudomonadota bacterium]